MRNFIEDHIGGVAVVAAVVFILLVVFIGSIPAMHIDYCTIEVTKTEITGDNDYMVFGKDTTSGEIKTFTLNDSFWHGNWDTADDYAILEIGQTYAFKTTGWRIPFFSAFPNIIKITKAQ